MRGVPWRRRYSGLAHHAAVGRELARGERGILQLGDAHREVEAFLDHVDVAVGEAERELDLRVAGGEIGHQRRDVLVAEGGGQGDPEDALRLAAPGRHRGVGLLDLGQDPAAGFEVGGAFVGEVQAAGGAVDEPHAEPRLERRQAPADQRRGKPQLPGGGGEASGRHDP